MRWEREKVLVREIEGLKGDGGVEERHEELQLQVAGM